MISKRLARSQAVRSSLPGEPTHRTDSQRHHQLETRLPGIDLQLNPRAILTVLITGLFIGSIGCAANDGSKLNAGGGGGTSGTGGANAGAAGMINQGGQDAGHQDACTPHCSSDRRGIAGCDELITKQCPQDQMCLHAVCVPACQAATELRSSVGCEYFPVQMEASAQAEHGCFALFVANAWSTPAHVSLTYRGVPLNAAQFGALPAGSGTKLSYTHYDPAKGIQPGQVGIFFLAGPADPNNSPSVACPDGFPPAVTDGTPQLDGTGKGFAFHVNSDIPVVAYQMLPYGAGSYGLAGASLLLPTSVWSTNYVAVNAYERGAVNTRPSLNIVAMQDGTEIKMVPKVEVEPGPGVKRAEAHKLMKITLNRGEQIQISQKDQLTGSPIEANKPVGLMAGHECMFVPSDKNYCDHAEQQIPPIQAMGSEYAVAPFRPRSSTHPEHYVYRLFGAVDGTKVTFDPPAAHAAATLSFGQILELETPEAFVVKSQDDSHPFLVAAYMTGSSTVEEGFGDPDFVRIVPPRQFLQRYVFFTDPTYPETNLVIVRHKSKDGFAEVNLDCAGQLKGWLPLGTSGEYEFVWFDLVRHNFEPNGKCDNGPHEMTSKEPFGLWVWGWGTGESDLFSKNVSYGYPAGESVLQLNNVHVPPMPK